VKNAVSSRSRSTPPSMTRRCTLCSRLMLLSLRLDSGAPTRIARPIAHKTEQSRYRSVDITQSGNAHGAVSNRTDGWTNLFVSLPNPHQTSLGGARA
jgi:hypothetical protein